MTFSRKPLIGVVAVILVAIVVLNIPFIPLEEKYSIDLKTTTTMTVIEKGTANVELEAISPNYILMLYPENAYPKCVWTLTYGGFSHEFGGLVVSYVNAHVVGDPDPPDQTWNFSFTIHGQIEGKTPEGYATEFFFIAGRGHGKGQNGNCTVYQPLYSFYRFDPKSIDYGSNSISLYHPNKDFLINKERNIMPKVTIISVEVYSSPIYTYQQVSKPIEVTVKEIRTRIVNVSVLEYLIRTLKK